LIEGGSIKGIELTRIHLEEDTARSSHDKPGVSLVDFNRAGVPLMELVTEPVIHSAEEAMSFAKELQLILQYLNVSEANMEKGEMRVEVNISISKDENFGTKVEVKNINSFKAAGRAIEYEFERHKAILERGEKVVQETRGWDENKNQSFSQRSKENAKDYRYFPDPDLPKLLLSEIKEFDLESLKKSLPILPQEKRDLYVGWGIKSDDAEFFVNNKEFRNFFEMVVARASAMKDEHDDLVMSSAIASWLFDLMFGKTVGDSTDAKAFLKAMSKTSTKIDSVPGAGYEVRPIFKKQMLQNNRPGTVKTGDDLDFSWLTR
jgi:aspartyl-tRNA(Asn)/glutamyl-tRNA(Gln) amidotransferase subunit B